MKRLQINEHPNAKVFFFFSNSIMTSNNDNLEVRFLITKFASFEIS